MAQDVEAQMIGFYILRGHTLDELLKLSSIEKAIYIAAMDRHNEEIQKIFEERSC